MWKVRGATRKGQNVLTPSVSEGGEEQTKRDRIWAMSSSGVDASGVAHRHQSW